MFHNARGVSDDARVLLAARPSTTTHAPFYTEILPGLPE